MYVFIHCCFVTGDAITSMLTSATDLVGRADQMFVVGQGLSNAGVKSLGQKLAGMTIGDIKSMLDLKNMDPVVVAELLVQIKDLAKALVSVLTWYHNQCH